MARTLGRRRGFDDDEEYPPVGNLRGRYRREAEAVFSSPPPDDRLPPDDDEPPVQAVVKWFRADKGYGFVQVEETKEDLFLPARAVGPDADLPAGATLTVRAGLDLKGKGRAVLSVLAIDRSTATNVSTGRRMPIITPNRVEVGRLDRKTAAGSGFIAADLGGADIYVSGAVLSAAPDVGVGDRIEADVGDGDRGPVAVAVRKL